MLFACRGRRRLLLVTLIFASTIPASTGLNHRPAATIWLAACHTPTCPRRVFCSMAHTHLPKARFLRMFSGDASVYGVNSDISKEDHDRESTNTAGSDGTIAVRMTLVNELLADAWAGKDGWCTSETEDASIDQIAGELSSTYGEITCSGFRALARAIHLCPADSFVDLGSGVGRTVVQAAIEFGCHSSVGIELSPSRHARAIRALNYLLTMPPPLHLMAEAEVLMCGVRLLEGDLLTTPICHATVCWVASLCFSEGFMQQVANKLATQGRDLRTIVSLSAFPNGVAGFELTSGDDDAFEMSWTQVRKKER